MTNGRPRATLPRGVGEHHRRLLLDGAARRRRVAAPPGTLRGIDFYDDDALARTLERALGTFFHCHGRWPAASAPVRFSDKLFLAKFFMPLPLPTPADKCRVASFIPPDLAAYVQPVPIAWSTSSAMLPEDGALAAGAWWLKASHGSGMNLRLDWPPGPARRAEAIARAARWLDLTYGTVLGEWWYATIPRALLLVPELMRRGQRAIDYKFAVIHGRIRYLLVAFDLPDGRRARSFFDPAAAERGEWRQLAVQLQGAPHPPVPRPAALVRLCEVARRLGASFEQVRVDLLHAAGGPIHLSELTLCDMDARPRYTPVSFDTEVGAEWDVTSWCP